MQKFTCSQILFDAGKHKRWTSLKSNSPKDGTTISSNTGNLQGRSWWRNDSVHIPDTSWQKHERFRAWDWWMDSTRSRRRWTTLSSRKLVLIEFCWWNWCTKFRFLHRDRKEVKRDFCKTRKEMHLTSRSSSPNTSLVQVRKRLGTLKSVQVTTKKIGWNGKASYGCVSCTEASNPERMYQFLARRIEERRWKHSLQCQWILL